ncbi:MAG: hypothetical protein RI955_2015 [Bacteroidota bacterium]
MEKRLAYFQNSILYLALKLKPLLNKVLLFIIFFQSTQLWAVDYEKYMSTKKIEIAPKIDGKANDECWKNISPIHLTYQFEPYTGNNATEPTEVKIVYDDEALYVFATCIDKHIDSIQHIFTTRGNVFKQTENFYVFFDTYHDGQNAYGFGVSIDNVQDDFKATNGGKDIDGSWDAVWESKTFIDKDGWYAEFKIPYSTIRFPKANKQDWTVDFAREIRRKKEITNWCPTPPTTSAFVPKMNPIIGIENIKPPPRISLSPYASAYYLSQGNVNGSNIKGGADIKYGISESFTLDMTLVPDFGQVISDQLVKNLSPYEIQYEERRPFFLEGAELFTKNNLFYSRRIGETSNYFYNHNNSSLTIQNEPQQSNLLNACKLSGKTKQNLSIGILNSITNNLFVTTIDSNQHTEKKIYEPLTNYNVFVVEKTIKNNSHIGFINTNVTRTQKGNDANVMGVDGRFYNKKNSLIAAFFANQSSIFNKADKLFTTVMGNSFGVGFGKITGMWQSSYNIEIIDKKYNPNDMGYLSKNNFINQNFSVNQIITKPFWRFLKMTNTFYFERENNYSSGKYSYNLFLLKSRADWRNHLTMVNQIAVKPTIQHDFYDPRTEGYFVNIPKVYQVRTYISSDYRKTFALDGYIDYVFLDEYHRDKFAYSIMPRIRPNKKILINYTYENIFNRNEKGFVAKRNNNIYFGKRDVKTISNSINIDYVFNNRISTELVARHYWSGGRYSHYYTLQNDGNLNPINDNLNANFDFNAWTLDMVFNWQFAPGSTITVAWKNLVYANTDIEQFKYINNFNSTFNNTLSNSFSIKILYFLNAGKILTRKK